MLATNKVSVVEGGGKLIEKSIELKTEKLLKSQKLSKFQKSAKSRKKLTKSGNSLNFNIKKNGPSFLNSKVKAVFNCCKRVKHVY